MHMLSLISGFCACALQLKFVLSHVESVSRPTCVMSCRCRDLEVPCGSRRLKTWSSCPGLHNGEFQHVDGISTGASGLLRSEGL